MSELKATGLSLGMDGSVTVVFNDRHQVRFAARLGFENRHTFDEFLLSLGGVIVVRYVSVYERPNNSQSGLVLASGYSPERIAEYWRVADEYVEQRLQTAEKQPFYMSVVAAHHVIKSARTDLTDLGVG